MMRTADAAGDGRAGQRGRAGKKPLPGRAERIVVLAGFAPAVLCTLLRPILDIGGDVAADLWICAALWAVFASAVLAFRRGRSAFRAWSLPDNDELVDWTTQTGAYAYMSVAEEHERLMRGD